MASITVAEIAGIVRNTLNIMGTSIVTDAEVVTAINDGYKDINAKVSGYISLLSLQATTGNKFIDVRSYNIVNVNYVTAAATGVAEYGVIRSLPITFGNNDPEITNESTYSGPPYSWFFFANTIVIDPTPDKTYSIYVYCNRMPTSILTIASTTFSASPEIIDLITLYAISMISLKVRRFGDFIRFRNQYHMKAQQIYYMYIKDTSNDKLVIETPQKVWEKKNESR